MVMKSGMTEYEKNRWKEGFGPGSPLQNQAGDGRA